MAYLSKAHGISSTRNHTMLKKWVNDFRIAGPDALKPKKKDRKKASEMSNTGNNNVSSSKSTIEQYIDYYNNQRIKQKLSWMSPVEYRLSQLL